MERQPARLKRELKRVLSSTFLLSALAAAPLVPSPAAAQERYVVKPVVEMKLKELPRGALYWRVENFPTLAEAKAAAGSFRWNPDTVSHDGSPSLAAEVAGKAWLFTLGAEGGATPGGSRVFAVQMHAARATGEDAGRVGRRPAVSDEDDGGHGSDPSGTSLTA